MANRPGIRGPQGPAGSGRTPKPGRAQRSGSDSALHRASMPIMGMLTRFPRWLLLILTGLFLFLGLIQTGPWTWLGVVFLSIVTVFFAWLLALSWPAVPTAGRIIRLIVVVALIGITVLKAMGRL
jgi:hypothetical protein